MNYDKGIVLTVDRRVGRRQNGSRDLTFTVGDKYVRHDTKQLLLISYGLDNICFAIACDLAHDPDINSSNIKDKYLASFEKKQTDALNVSLLEGYTSRVNFIIVLCENNKLFLYRAVHNNFNILEITHLYESYGCDDKMPSYVRRIRPTSNFDYDCAKKLSANIINYVSTEGGAEEVGSLSVEQINVIRADTDGLKIEKVDSEIEEYLLKCVCQLYADKKILVQ